MSRIPNPMGTEPVKVTPSTRASATIAPPIDPGPRMRFSTPGGRPASAKTSAIATDVRGVLLAVFQTIVFPAASAGAIFQTGIRIGKFHGVNVVRLRCSGSHTSPRPLARPTKPSMELTAWWSPTSRFLHGKRANAEPKST